MGKHYDENKVVNILAKQGIRTKWEFGTNCVVLNKSKSYGIHTWGKLDYLVNHCHYHIIWINDAIKEDTDSRNERKQRKEKSEFKHKKNARKMNS